jgi:hypothetical protein
MSATQTQDKKIPVVKCLVFILDWDNLDRLSGVLVRANVRFQFIAKGRGTASSEMLNLLGLGATEKAVILCLEQEEMVPGILRLVGRELGFYRPGAGIEFSAPLSGINTPLLKVFKESVSKDVAKISTEEGIRMGDERKYELILTVVNQGYSDDLMAKAREAGAGGGTVINGRGVTHEGPVKFLGISVQEEREIVLILADKEHKLPIMRAVSEGFGVSTEAAGVVFSLPVDMTMGLR